jgi:hypothetical protein
VTILDGSGGRIGQGPAMIVGPYGGQGTFTATVPFSVPVDSQLGRIQVWSESPRDGAIEHLSSVTVMLQGYDLDPLLERLDVAIKARDYAGLEATMSSSFQLGLYKSDAASLPRSQAVAQLRQIYLGPGAPRLDFSVDAHKLLGDRVTFKPDVIHVVYSTGWGAEKADDAFLLIGDVGGRAAWTGMLYVPKAKIDYR